MKTAIISLLTGILLIPLFLPAQQSKARKKEIEKYWKNEVKRSKSIKHDRVATQFPEIGWLSGLWCKDGESKARRHYEILGKWEVRLGTRGYTAEDKKRVIFPESFQVGEFLDKPVVINNANYYEFWTVSGDGKGIYGPLWYIYLERIEKISDSEFKRVYAKSYTYKKEKLDLAAFAKEESFKINHFKHYKTPQIYRKCN